MTAIQHLLRFRATVAGLEEAGSALRALLDAHHVEGTPRYNVELAFEEVATNIVRYGFPAGDVEVALGFDNDEIILTFEDDGVPFDPRGQPAPALPTSIDEAQVGGLGLVLVRKVLTRMSYERTPQHRNHLTLAIAAR
jgi:serine/threonine-protein kinase RsbW